MKKICSKCSVEKDISDFGRRTRNRDGYNGVCKKCRYCYKYSEKYKRSALNTKLKADYGITLREYDEMLEEQKGVCAICGNPQPPKFFRLAVDHCHKTGKVRGLLCQSCNGMLGLAKDNIEVMLNAIKYLSK